MTADDYIRDLKELSGIFAGYYGCIVDKLSDEIIRELVESSGDEEVQA